MKRFFTFVFAVILFTQNVFAETEIDPTDISFESNRKFISSLANVLEQDYDAADVKKGLKQFNDRSVGYRADSFDALIEKLPLASNDLIQSAKQLEVLTDPKLLVKLQEEIYFSAVGTISPEAAQSARASYRTPALAAVALLGGVAGVGGGGGSGPANPQVSISVASASFSENGGSTDVTLTLDRAIEADLEVTLNFTSDATDGTDYTTDATATISAGDTTTSFTVTAVDDSVYEGDETGIITIASVDQVGVGISSTNSVTITILEDETVPTVSLAASAASVSEESGSGITFTASIDQVAAVDLTVTLAVTVNSRSRSYTPNVPSSIDITIPAGSLTGSAVYTPTDNNSYDGTSNVSFAVSSVVGGGAVANTVNISTTNATETVAITETESAPTVELTALTRTIAEGDDDLTLTATLTGSTYEDVTIVLALAGTATSGSDYSLANITIPAGTTTATAAFSPTADSLYEGANEVATITIGSVSGGGVSVGAANTASITITDGDSAPTVTLASSASSVAEGSSVTLTATLSVATTAAVTVPLDTSGATEGTDYGALSDITIAAGSTTGTVTLTATDDSVYEGTETATVSIGTVSGGSASAASSGTSVVVSITDAQTAPTVGLSASAESVLEDGSAITLTATLSGVADEDVTVPIDTSGTATEGTDYSAISDITISAGSTTGTATITPTDDSVSEGAETLIVSLGTLSGADATAGSTSSLTLNFVDDDVPNITLTASTTSIAENSGSSITLTVTTSMVATEDIVVSLGSAGTATSGTDYTALPSSLTIAAGDTTKTTSFTPTDDSLYDATSDETAIITISSVSGGNALESGDQSVTLTITDNESAPTVTLAVSDATVSEDGGTSTITATLSGATYQDVTVSLSAAGTAVDDTDYTYGGSITIAQGTLSGTDTLTSTADDLYDAARDESAIISIATVSGGGASEDREQTVTITITDSESAPTVTLSRSNSTVQEDGGTSTLTATLSHATYEDVAISLSDSGAATDDEDFTYTGSIAILAGQLAGTDTFTSLADDLYDAATNESTTISISRYSGGGVTAASNSQSVSITIVDAESAPTVTLSADNATVSEDGGVSTITATLSGATYETVTISLSDSGTATDRTDFTYTGSITIRAGQLTGTDTFTSSADDIYDATVDESTTISISNVSGGGVSAFSDSQSVSIAIDDAESAPTVTLSRDTATVDEDRGSSIITATLSVATFQDVTVTLSDSGTAVDDVDFAYAGSIVIPAGRLTGTDTFTPLADDLFDAASNETSTIAISGVSGGGASENGNQSVSIAISDAESAPTVTLEVSSARVTEGGTNPTLTVTASHKSYADIVVALVADASSTASVSDDYSFPATITIAAGELDNTGTLTIVNDSVYDGGTAETVVVNIDSVSGGSEDRTQSETVSITDNESAPVLTLSGTQSSTAERNGTAITITVSSSVAADTDMTVTLSASGTGITSDDYTLTTATISALSQASTATFTALDDQVYEGGSETASISVGSVAGVSDVRGSGSISITITEKALDGGTSATEVSGLANSVIALSEYQNIDLGSIHANTDHSPFENINLAQAFGYNLTGQGETIAILDSGFMVNGAGYVGSTHVDLDDKNISSYGNFTSYSQTNNYHGTNVAGAAAADFGDGGITGVAPHASLLLTDFSYDYQPTSWAASTNAATGAGAVVQNNSWGFDQQYGAAGADVFVQYMNNNGLTGYQTLVAFQSIDTNADGVYDVGASSSVKPWTISDWSTYVSALQNFQSNGGVVVFALSNDDSKTDADISAALPELFPSLSLDSAWITAANVDISGTSSKTYDLVSAPCGITAAYCIAGDGYRITLPGGSDIGSGSSGYAHTAGTSFVAPQVSGAIAILAQHFPNHTNEELVDRLLASADNNIGFTYAGSVTFGNGVVHEYSAEAGHGIMDVYAALQPIRSPSYITRVISFSSSGDVTNFDLSATRLSTSRSFGDALLSALTGEETFMYDALDGGFAFEMDKLAIPSLSVSQPSMSFATELSKTVLSERLKSSILRAPRMSSQTIGYFEASVQQTNKTLQNHVAEGQWSGFNDVQYIFPFLSSIQSGDGLSFGDDIGNDYLSFSWNKQHEKFSDGERKEALTVSYSTTLGTATDLQFIGGVADENEYFLGTKGSGAFDFTGADNITSFFGMKSTTPIGDDLIFSAGMALSYTDVNKPASGIITEISGVTASAFEIGVTAFNVIGNDALSLSIGQPHRVESGSAHLKIAGLENQDGTVPFVEKTASLAPSGRQIDLAMAYNFDLDQTSAVRFKMMQTFEKGHVKNADRESSLYLGYATEDVFGEDSLAFGAAFIDDRDPSLELKYSIRW